MVVEWLRAAVPFAAHIRTPAAETAQRRVELPRLSQLTAILYGTSQTVTTWSSADNLQLDVGPRAFDSSARPETLCRWPISDV
jgi:hypothetical protein